MPLRIELTGDRPAILAPGRKAITYAELTARTEALAARLAARGLRRGDAVAVVMSDGPEQLITMLAVMQVAACAPLNPAFRAPELEFALADLRAQAVIVAGDLDSPARGVAEALGIAVIVPDDAGPPLPERAPPVYPENTTLLLHTSATTGQPKLVPWTDAQLVAMVGVSHRALPIARQGRVLLLTPHFHLHCIFAILVQLLSGGAVICTGGYRPDRFLDWMRSLAPTHYTANPTVHRAIADAGDEGVFRTLRFVTSAGAPLTLELRGELERKLGVPVLDGYGLTEAGAVTLTPLEPARRRPGSVGEVIGPEVAIAAADGAFLPPGGEGEILLRGPTVITAYAHQPPFADGWLRTGDLGRLDADGFLTLTGRKKELINRGAEKIRPYEVEAVLARHPSVKEVAVFGVPHARLGEDVAAAVVLRPGARLDFPEVRRFAAGELAEFKIPRRFVVVADIPKGMTGKPQRARLAELLGLTARPVGRAPRDPLEARVAGIWSNLLEVAEVTDEDDFFALGGDSLLATRMLAEVEAASGCRLDLGALGPSGRFGTFMTAVRAGPPAEDVLTLARGDGPGLFLVNGLLFRRLLDELGPVGPVHGIKYLFDEIDRAGGRVADVAATYVTRLRQVQPAGPYLLGGFSLGGVVAFEMARQLVAQGERIAGVVLIDSDCYGRARARRLVDRAVTAAARLTRLPVRDWLPHIRARVAARLASRALRRSVDAVGRSYAPSPLAARVLLLCCLGEEPVRRARLKRDWAALVGDGLTIKDVSGDHATVLTEAGHIRQVAAEVRAFLHASPRQAAQVGSTP